MSGHSKTSTLASRLATSIQKHNVPGASAAIFRGGEWEVAAAGVSNVTTGVDITSETVLPVGSILKVVNATLVMQLVDEGLIELASPLKRYLPDFNVADRDPTERITVGILLTHTSGIDAEYFSDAGPDSERIEDVIPLIAQQSQIHARRRTLVLQRRRGAGRLRSAATSQRAGTHSSRSEFFKPLEMEHSVVQQRMRYCTAPRLDIFSTLAARTFERRLHFESEPRASRHHGHAFSEDLATFALAHVNDGVALNDHRLLSAAALAACGNRQRRGEASAVEASGWAR